MNSLLRPNGQLMSGNALSAAAVAALAVLFGAGSAFAQDTVLDEQPPAMPEVAEDVMEDFEPDDDLFDAESVYTVDVSALVTHAYYFRGYLQENDGLIFQPAVEIGFPVYSHTNADGDTDFELAATLGTWNSFHSENTGNVSGPSNWYESDLYATLSTTYKDVALFGTYTAFTAPNGAFSTIQELAVGAGYEWELNEEDPFVVSAGTLVAFETRDSGGSEDIYWEVTASVAKDFDIQDQAVSFEVPVVLGFSIDDYYVDADGDNEFFGYVGVGLNASVPLPFKEGYGDWYLTGGVQGLFLSADVLELVNEDDSAEFIGSVGVGVSF